MRHGEGERAVVESERNAESELNGKREYGGEKRDGGRGNQEK